MGASKRYRSKGKQAKGGRKKRQTRQKKSLAPSGAYQKQVLADCLGGKIPGCEAEEHKMLYDNLRGGAEYPKLSLEYFRIARELGEAHDFTPYIIPEEEDDKVKQAVKEEEIARIPMHGGGDGNGKGVAKREEVESPTTLSVQARKKKKKNHKKKEVSFHKDVRGGPKQAKTSVGDARSSFGYATDKTRPTDEVPDRLSEPIKGGSGQYSYPAVENVDRVTRKMIAAKMRSGKAISEEDEYSKDISTPAQQADVDRCLDDIFASVKPAHDEEEDEEEELIPIMRTVYEGDGLHQEKMHISSTYTTLRFLHPMLADWLVTAPGNLGFNQFLNFIQAIVNQKFISKRQPFKFKGFLFSCEIQGGIPWLFTYSPTTKIDTQNQPCRLYSFRVRFNTYTEQEQELRISQVSQEEDLLQKKEDLGGVIYDYMTCLIHLGIPPTVQDSEASRVDTIDAAREHIDFPIVVVNAQFELMV